MGKRVSIDKLANMYKNKDKENKTINPDGLLNQALPDDIAGPLLECLTIQRNHMYDESEIRREFK